MWEKEPHSPIRRQCGLIRGATRRILSLDVTIACPRCRKDIHPNRIDPEKRIARCGFCLFEFEIKKELAHAAYRAKPLTDLVAPESIQVDHTLPALPPVGYRGLASRDEPSMRMTVRAYARSTLFYRSVAYALAFAVVGLAPAIAIGITSIFSWFYLGVTLFVLAPMASRLYLKSRHRFDIALNGGVLTVRNRKTSRSFPVAEVHQIYCTESHNENEPPTFNVIGFIGRDHTPLAESLTSWEQALYIERVLEHHLAIDNEPIPGELPGHPSDRVIKHHMRG